MGTYQIALLAHSMNKPVYVAAESYKVCQERKNLSSKEGKLNNLVCIQHIPFGQIRNLG